jgi:hypothetical protein
MGEIRRWELGKNGWDVWCYLWLMRAGGPLEIRLTAADDEGGFYHIR